MRQFPPRRIVCLTEETVETLYLLGEQDRIVGVSGYAVRPPQVRREKPRVSAFISADIPKILALEPDLVLAFSDLQADIVADLVRAGVAIHVFNQRDVAGILLDETFAKAKEANWDKVLRVHLKGTFCCTQPVFKWMRENGGGVIVNTSSTSGLIGNFGQTNYGAAKGGIWGLSNVLAIEGRKYNIRIWTLAPGALTRMTADLPRYIENPGAALGPDGIAPAVLYMVSDLSGDQTGKVLGVSGPRGVREMRMMEMDGWKPPHTGWKAQDVVEHAKDIFFSEEQIKMGARRF